MLLVVVLCYSFRFSKDLGSLLLATQIPQAVCEHPIRFANESSFPWVYQKEKTPHEVVFFFLVHLQGFEPGTHWLRVSCSTNWAKGAYFSFHSAWIIIAHHILIFKYFVTKEQFLQFAVFRFKMALINKLSPPMAIKPQTVYVVFKMFVWRITLPLLLLHIRCRLWSQEDFLHLLYFRFRFLHRLR